eukprot:6205442-Pleurochrysis_carterae.AAC.1
MHSEGRRKLLQLISISASEAAAAAEVRRKLEETAVAGATEHHNWHTEGSPDGVTPPAPSALAIVPGGFGHLFHGALR